jgi:uncharacterized RDD family membrane protein YckC
LIKGHEFTVGDPSDTRLALTVVVTTVSKSSSVATRPKVVTALRAVREERPRIRGEAKGARMTQTTDVELDYARWSTRAWSWIIDFFVVAFYWLVITVVNDVVLWPIHSHFFDGPGLTFPLGAPGDSAGSVFVLLYWVILVTMDGRTVGMAQSSTRLVVVDQLTGDAPTWQQSFVRYIFYGVSLFLLSRFIGPWSFVAGVVVLVVDYVVVPLSDKKRRTLHDVAAGTVVRQLPPDADGGRTARSKGRRWLVRTTAVLVAVMLVGGFISSWLERQPNPASALGVADKLVTYAPLAAQRHGHSVITINDVETALLYAPAQHLDDLGVEMAPMGSQTLVIIGPSHRACIHLSGVAGVAPRVVTCSVADQLMS